VSELLRTPVLDVLGALEGVEVKNLPVAQGRDAARRGLALENGLAPVVRVLDALLVGLGPLDVGSEKGAPKAPINAGSSVAAPAGDIIAAIAQPHAAMIATRAREVAAPRSIELPLKGPHRVEQLEQKRGSPTTGGSPAHPESGRPPEITSLVEARVAGTEGSGQNLPFQDNQHLDGR
jgi:hypothetical protein